MKKRNFYNILKIILFIYSFGLIFSTNAYDQEFPSVRLRYGFRYSFYDVFNNTTNSDIGLNKFRVIFNEKQDFNGGNTDPIFSWTPGIINKGYIVNSLENYEFVNSEYYDINYHPTRREVDNISIIYDVTYYKRNGNTWSGPFNHTERQPYEITWCGDGTLDNYTDPSGVVIHEECDPNDPTRQGWGNRTCNQDCSFSNEPVVCTNLDANPTSGDAPLNSNFSCTGQNASTYNIQVYDLNNNVLDTILSRNGSYTFNNPGVYTVSCFVDGQPITPAACTRTINVGGQAPQQIQIEKYSANPNDFDGNTTHLPTDDSQTVIPTTPAIFNIRVQNIGTENLNTITLTDALAPNCAGVLNNGIVGGNNVTYGGLGNHNNNILEVGETFTYTCSQGNTTASYTNSATVVGTGVNTGIQATDTDTSNVVIEPRAIELLKFSGNPADTDGDISHTPADDSQTIGAGANSIFNIRVTNYGNENLNSVILTDTLSPNCAGTLSGGTLGTNPVTFSGMGDHTNNILEIGEVFDYSCNRVNVLANFTNSATVNATGVNSNIGVTDTDISNVVISGLTNACISLTANPTSASNSLTSTLACTGNNVNTFRIDCGNGTELNGVGNNNGNQSFTGSCSYNSNGNYTATCYVNGTTNAPACVRGLSVTGGSSDHENRGGASSLQCLNLTFGTGTGELLNGDNIRINPDTTNRRNNNITFNGTNISVPVICEGNSSANYAQVDCGTGGIEKTSNNRISNKIRINNYKANFICKYNNNIQTKYIPKCYVGANENSILETNRLYCMGRIIMGPGGCGDGILQLPEQCDFGEYNGPTSVCGIDCKLKERTIPGEGDIKFGPKTSVIIGDNVNPFERIQQYPYVYNGSEFDINFDKLCVVKNNIGSSIIWPNVPQCIQIGVLPSGERREFGSYPSFRSEIENITSLNNYEDNNLITTIQQGNQIFTNSEFFSGTFKVRVSKPSIKTTGGGTSYVKSSNGIVNINDVTKGKDDNFKGTSVSDLSSSSKQITDPNSIAKVSQEGKSKENSFSGAINEIGSSTADNTISLNDFTNFNGLSNVFILKNKNFTVNSINVNDLGKNGPTTYIIENGNLIITDNIILNNNIAFVVKGGNIIISDSITEIDGTYITIKKDLAGGKIKGENETQIKLVIKGSLYGNITDLVNKRTYIEEVSGGKLEVGTVVNFGSQAFKTPAPLTGKFIGEYIESKKVAQ